MNLASLRGSLRLRLLLTTLTWIVASIVVAGWGLGSLFRSHVEAQFNADLGVHLDQLTAHLVLDGQGRPALSVPLSDPRFNRPFGGLYWQIDRVAGPAMPAIGGALRSRSLWDQVLAVPADVPLDGDIHRHIIGGPKDTSLGAIERTVRIDDVQLRLIAAADEALMIEPVARFNGALWLALGVLGLGLAFAALLQVVVGLAPLRQLRLALGRVRAGGTRHLEGSFPTELRPLVNEFNSVLTQNAEVVERARTHAGNLAHALKTPLSVLANAARGRDEELARLVLGQVETAQKQVDYHLARAQAAAAVHMPGVRTPVGPALEGLVRVMERIYAGRNLQFAIQSTPNDLAFRGEQQDLQEMLGNLLENACKWAATRVEIRAGIDGDRLDIRIADDGPGIAAEQREAVIRRGARADEQVPGTGLGLAIVDDLARMYGGQLTLAESSLGGLLARLNLPASVQ
ncbi:MAG: sensor histidine kinase [Rhodocyclales bacterium]|nr:sensor histidine kinase [Rhodocyclales bacterium]